MASSSPTSSKIPPTQVALNDILVWKIRWECEIPVDCKLEVLGPQYTNWRNDLKILPPGSIIVSDLHLQNLWLPLPPFFHYFFGYTQHPPCTTHRKCHSYDEWICPLKLNKSFWIRFGWFSHLLFDGPLREKSQIFPNPKKRMGMLYWNPFQRLWSKTLFSS